MMTRVLEQRGGSHFWSVRRWRSRQRAPFGPSFALGGYDFLDEVIISDLCLVLHVTHY